VTSHWVYDQNTLASHVASIGGEGSAPFMAPINPFYHVTVGENSCYGDQTWSLLDAMATKGGLNLEEYRANLTSLMGGDSPYGPLGRTIAQEDMPIQGPWRHGEWPPLLPRLLLRLRLRFHCCCEHPA